MLMLSMLFLSLLALVSLPLSSAAPSDDTHGKLVTLAAAGGGLIKLNASSYGLLTTPHRDWSASIEFTALDTGRGCASCKKFHASWSAVAKAWAKAPQADRDCHFFATLDVDDGEAVFRALGLDSGPVFHIYPATEGSRATPKSAPSKHDRPSGFGAAQLAQHLSKHTPIPIPYAAPFDWRRWMTAAAGLLAFTVSLRFAVPILQSRWTWALAVILPSLVLTSGYMFTHINSSPFAGSNGRWIARGTRNQFGKEVLVVAIFYGILCSAFLMLIAVIPYYQSARRQRVQIYLCSALIMFIYSVLVMLFRSKSRDYPFRLLV